MLNLSPTRRFWKIFSTTWLWKISVWPLYYDHILAAEKLRTIDSNKTSRLKGYYNNAINVRISLDGYGSKIRKVSRCRPTVSNETILATKQVSFFTKVAPAQNITDIVLLGFVVNTYFILYYHPTPYIFFRMFKYDIYSNILICFLVEK